MLASLFLILALAAARPVVFEPVFELIDPTDRTSLVPAAAATAAPVMPIPDRKIPSDSVIIFRGSIASSDANCRAS